jgi:hypothetical protein
MHAHTPRAARPVRLRACAALGLLTLAALVLAACGSSTESRRVALVEVDGRARFDTAAITVTKGDTLELTVVNRTDARQALRIDALGVERSVPPDAAVTVDIEAKRPGTYRMSSTNGADPLSIVVPN